MTRGQCRAARSWLGWSTRELAARAGIGESTVKRFELGNDIRYSSAQKIRETLETAGIVFEGKLVVRLRGEESDDSAPPARARRSGTARRADGRRRPGS